MPLLTSFPSTIVLYRYHPSLEFPFWQSPFSGPGYILPESFLGGREAPILLIGAFFLLKCDNGYTQIISREEKQHSFNRRN